MQENANETIDLFVPGRLCLFGKHSDWAGLFDRKVAPMCPEELEVLFSIPFWKMNCVQFLSGYAKKNMLYYSRMKG